MKTYIKNNLEAVKEYLTGLSNDDLVNVWNEYAREHDRDNEIYSNEEDFFNTYFEGRLMEAIRAISFGEYNYSDSFIRFNGYANLETFNDPENYIYIEGLAQAILDNPTDFYNIELEEDE
jgi:hypothetical protein